MVSSSKETLDRRYSLQEEAKNFRNLPGDQVLFTNQLHMNRKKIKNAPTFKPISTIFTFFPRRIPTVRHFLGKAKHPLSSKSAYESCGTKYRR